MMAYILTDYDTNAARKRSFVPGDERSIFSEVFFQIFKYFANVLGHMSFVWGEKQCDASQSVWLPLKDYSSNETLTKLLDGYGTLVSPSPLDIVLVESSGFNRSENVELEDTLKHFKSSTDVLKSLINDNQHANYHTLKKVKAVTIQVIQQRMTLVATSVYSPKKRSVVQVRSALVPCSRNDGSNRVKVFELLSFLHTQLGEQKLIIKGLNDEHLGVIDVGSECLVENILKDIINM